MNRFDQLPKVLQNKIYEYNADHRPQWKDVMRDLIMYDMENFHCCIDFEEEEGYCLEPKEEALMYYYRFLVDSIYLVDCHLLPRKFQLRNINEKLYEVARELKMLLNDLYLNKFKEDY
jgi:hypothetical protein